MINDLIKIMQRGKHCAESIAEVTEATTFKELFNLMFDYKKDLGKKHFPGISFVRKHYPNIKDLANMNGFFCDEKDLKIQDIWKTILMGDCDCEFTVSECKSVHIIARHKTNVRLILNNFSKANIYISEKATVEVISRTELSHINIFRYE